VRTTSFLILVFGSLLPACGSGEVGVEDFREGRFLEAHAALRDEVEAAGEEAPDRLRYNRGLAALRAGDFRDAEAQARLAAGSDDPGVGAHAEFLRGNAAFALARMAEQQADSLEAEPFAFEIAMGYARTARDGWQRAAVTREDWPEASRNVERAVLLIESLKDRKTKAERKRDPRPDPKPAPIPDPPEPGPKSDQDPEKKDPLRELTASEIERLFDVLAEKERAKLEIRRANRRERMAGVERDW
jgi:tetratricopeptide (TPR) repeat protein